MNEQSATHRNRSRGSLRRGATLVEMSVILSVFITVLFGFLDLGLVMLRQTSLTAGARRVSREASLHGQLAPPSRSAWGPDTVITTADEAADIGRTIRPSLVGVEDRLVRIQIEWPDGGNAVGQRVRVTAICPHESLFPFLFGGRVDLRSVCVSRIKH